MSHLTYELIGRSVKILSYGPAEPWQGEEPYSPYPAEIPEVEVNLSPIPLDLWHLQSDAARAREMDEDLPLEWPQYLCSFLEVPRHQVLGYPFRFRSSRPRCPKCGAMLLLVATVASAAADGVMFTDYDRVLVCFFTCADCRVVHAEQECD